MKLLTAHYLDNGPYQLYETEVPDELLEGASFNIIEFLHHGSLEDTIELLRALLQKNDGYHLNILKRCAEDVYMFMIIFGAQHITDYVLLRQPGMCGRTRRLVQPSCSYSI